MNIPHGVLAFIGKKVHAGEVRKVVTDEPGAVKAARDKVGNVEV